MAGLADELFLLRKSFYTGAYEQVASSAFDSSNICRTNSAEIDRRCLGLRALTSLQRWAEVAAKAKEPIKLPEANIARSGQQPSEVRACALYAGFYKAICTGKKQDAETALTPLEQLAHSEACQHIALVHLLYAQALLWLERQPEALQVLQPFTRNLECNAVQVQIYITMHRQDLAARLLESMKQWSDDAILAQLAEGWLNCTSNSSQKAQDAFYVFEELLTSASEKDAKSRMALSLAISQFQLRDTGAGEKSAQLALSMDGLDGNVLATNLNISINSGFSVQNAEKQINQFKTSAPFHPHALDLESKSQLFDKCAGNFA